MKQNHTDYRTKLQAVFLSVIMVVSTVGMSVAFAGVVAADTPAANGEYVDFDGADVEQVETGQNVYLIGPDIDGLDEGDSLDLRIVDTFDTDGENQVSSSTSVETLFVDDIDDAPDDVEDADNAGDVFLEIETDDLDDGDYFVRGGDLPRNPLEEDTFEVRIDDLNVAFDDDEVANEGVDTTTDLDIDRNVGDRYSVNVSADSNLDEEELLEVFVDQNFADGAVVDLHQTANISQRIRFDGADRVVVDGDAEINGETIDEIDGEVRFKNLDDDQLIALFEAGLVEVEDDNVDLSGVSNALNETLDDDPTTDPTPNDIASTFVNEDAFELVNPFFAFSFNDDEDDADEQIVLVDIRNDQAELDFTDIDVDGYTFNFDVADTTAGDSDQLFVSSPFDGVPTYSLEFLETDANDPYGFGVPGPTDQAFNEFFGDDPNQFQPDAAGDGVLFTFVDGEWKQITGEDEVTGLQGYVLTDTDQDVTATAQIAQDESQFRNAQFDLDAGKNFITPTALGDIDQQDTFLLSDGDVNQVQNPYQEPISPRSETDFNSAIPGADSVTVNPFAGYFVVSDSGTYTSTINTENDQAAADEGLGITEEAGDWEGSDDNKNDPEGTETDEEPILQDVSLETNEVSDGTELQLTVTAESDTTVDFLSRSLEGPNGVIFGGGTGQEFTEIEDGVWETEFTYTVSDEAASGEYHFNNVQVRNKGNLQSDPWPDELSTTINNN